MPRHIDYPEVPLFEILSSSARENPDRIAFSCKETSLTYNELDRLTNKLASGIKDSGVGKGDNVLLSLPNSLEFVIGFLQ